MTQNEDFDKGHNLSLLIEPIKADKLLHQAVLNESYECDCENCRGMCCNPCWPTFMEAQEMIQAGYGSRLMCFNTDWDARLGGTRNYIEIAPKLLIPAKRGYEGMRNFDPNKRTQDMRAAFCTFFDTHGHCELHNTPYKPVGARLVKHGMYECAITVGDIKYDIWHLVVATWNHKAAQAIIEPWKKEFGRVREM